MARQRVDLSAERLRWRLRRAALHGEYRYACAGGFAGQLYTVNTATPLKIENQSYNTGCAAAGVPQTFTFT
jgi:hypothetical protein